MKVVVDENEGTITFSTPADRYRDLAVIDEELAREHIGYTCSYGGSDRSWIKVMTNQGEGSNVLDKEYYIADLVSRVRPSDGELEDSGISVEISDQTATFQANNSWELDGLVELFSEVMIETIATYGDGLPTLTVRRYYEPGYMNNCRAFCVADLIRRYSTNLDGKGLI